MKQIKKLARRGMARTLALLTAIFFGVAAVFGLIMLGDGVKQALLMAVTMIVMFGFILLIFVLIGSVPYLRVGKMVKRQCEDLGIELNEEEDFEFVTKEISMSKNWIVSGLYGSNFALHRRSIDHVEETSYYQKGRTYPMILLFVGPKKKYKIICSRKGDFERVTDALDQWFPPIDTPAAAEDQAGEKAWDPAEEDRQARRDRILRQEQGQNGKKTIAAILGVVGMVVVFSVIYNLLPARTSAPKTTPNIVGQSSKPKSKDRQVDAYIATINDDQFQQIAQGLIVETDGDVDQLSWFVASEEEDQTSFVIYNGTPYFFYGEAVIRDAEGKKLGTVEIPLAKPYDYCLAIGTVGPGADGYEYTTMEFYSLSYAAASVRYQYMNDGDETTSWIDILLASEDLSEDNVEEICMAEYYSNVLSQIASEELMFFDENDLKYVNDDENEGLDRTSAKYRAVLDIDRGVIEWYSINNGTETALSSLTMK